ncbi:hypothetical protein GCM10028805_27140 [Spirosoma harenae]
MMSSEPRVFYIKVIREPGEDTFSGTTYGYAEEEIEIEAVSKLEAYKKSHLYCNIEFRGQTRRTFIDDEEYFDERY